MSHRENLIARKAARRRVHDGLVRNLKSKVDEAVRDAVAAEERRAEGSESAEG